MRQIGTLPSARDAARLGDYLLAHGIKVRVDETTEGAAIWVYDEDQVRQAAELLAEYTRDPNDPRYEGAANAAREVQKQAARKEAAFRKNVVDLRSRWSAARAGRQPLTMFLLAASIVVTVATHFGEPTNPWFGRLTIVPFEIQGDWVSWHPGLLGLRATLTGEPWRLITPIFIHMNPVHLVFNLYALMVFGTLVEFVRGTWRTLVLVLLLAVISNVAQFYWSGPTFGGMSGVVYGLFGYAWMKSRFEHDVRLDIGQTNVAIMIGWLFLCMTGWVGSIANAAHVAGLIAGAAIGAAPTLWQRLRPR